MFASSELTQDLRPFLDDLSRFDSTTELEKSRLYQELRPGIERILGHVWHEELAPQISGSAEIVRAVAWNIERGTHVDEVVHLLQEHPLLVNSDVLLLSELDWGMARTGNRFVAREIAASLRMNYAFAPCYVALTKGAGVEKNVSGENRESLHGNALLSRFPMHRAHSLALPNGKDKMTGAEKRIGSQRAVIADIEHPSGMIRVVSLHLDAHSSQRHRYLQMRRVLEHVESLSPRLPALIG